MSKKQIPKVKASNCQKIPKPNFFSSNNNGNVVFSFASLEWTKYFNLDGSCMNWSFELFNMLKSVSTISKVDLLSGKFPKYRVHDHRRAKAPDPLPNGVELKDCYQLRISKTKGGIHGIFVDNIFYVIWLDPLHNMYPDSRYGGLREIKPPNTCCRDRETKIFQLQEENKKLKDENEYWERELSKL